MDEATKPIEAPGRFAAFASRDFRLLWIGATLSSIGTWAHVVAQGWLMYELTNSPLWLGYIGLVRALPLLAFPLVGGVIADRFSRLKILSLTQAAALVAAAVLALTTAVGHVQPWHLLCFAFFSAVVQALDNPARQALLPDLVPPEAMLAATSMNSWSFNLAMLLGPAIAAALIPVIGFSGVFAVNALSFAVLLGIVQVLRVKDGAMRSTSTLESLSEGLQYMRTVPFVLALFILTATVSLLGRSYAHLMPVLARDLLGLDASGMSLLYVFAGLGAVCAAMVLAGSTKLPGKGQLAFMSASAVAVLLVVLALSRSPLLSQVTLFMLGASLVVFSTSVTTLLQLTTPKDYRGRVMAANQMAWQGLEYLGVLFTGTLAVVISVPPVLVASGVLVVLTCGAIYRLYPLIWKQA
jgi:MFS family permease